MAASPHALLSPPATSSLPLSSSATPPPAPKRIAEGAASRCRRVLAVVTAAGLLGLAACASVPNPTGEMATARAAVDNARRAGAGQLAEAEMGEAQDRLTFAERAHSAKEYEAARRAAEQARASAELAEEKARLAKARQAKAELDDTLKALRGGAVARPVQ
jgi:hypothetical protein